jgi:hypothetical protein
MKAWITAACAVVLLASTAQASTESPTWTAYLDYAYVYSSADADALRARLKGYGEEAGVSLDRYISEYFETLARFESEDEDEASTRRKAVAYLLSYLASNDPESLERSVVAIRELGARLERQENRYWYHYILAHHALEKGYAADFVEEMLDMWVGVVLPLEAPYDTLDTLSLSNTPNSGFVAALPYLYENVTRLILLRSQDMGLDRDMDPLAAIVRFLHDGRVGAHPDVIPPEASARAYLDRIVKRLDGPESDAGSLTFTLALFEATKYHERARSLLASDGLGEQTLRAMRRSTGAYDTALHRAGTAQGKCAVYTRVLRQIGELYAAKQRLGVDPEIEMPFSIEGAIETYGRMREAPDGWRELGYRDSDRQHYIDAMRRLWEEIQETSLNAADYYLTRSVEEPHRADDHSRSAARVYARYLAFFYRYATERGKEAVPDSAYFAAFEAAKGFGDAFLNFAAEPSPGEIELATKRYRSALSIFPFDRELWPALTSALGRYGREAEYQDLVQPIADWVVRSRSVNSWVESNEPNSREIASLRRALSDSQVVMYLGFAEAADVAELEAELQDLIAQRARVKRELAELTQLRDGIRAGAETPAAPALDPATRPLDLAEVARKVADTAALLTKLDQQIAARSHALPLYKQTLDTDGLTREMRAQRDHPVHILLRRMYHEGHSRKNEEES